jgi:hypothetical protein
MGTPEERQSGEGCGGSVLTPAAEYLRTIQSKAVRARIAWLRRKYHLKPLHIIRGGFDREMSPLAMRCRVNDMLHFREQKILAKYRKS